MNKNGLTADEMEKLDELRNILENKGIGLEEEEGKERKVKEEKEMKEETFEETLAFLDEMVGMEQVKEKLMRLGRYVQWKKKLEAVGIDTSNFPEPDMTFMFLGDSGTGKTTVAYRMGRILHSLGLLESRKVVEFRREDLMGENYGSEEKLTKEALKRARGSVFFLDEAYQCFKNSTDMRDPGYHVLETMMAQFGKPGRCIIMAGYKEEMMELMKVNKGFCSRIPRENIIEFNGSSESNLMKIAMNAIQKMELYVSPGARTLLRESVHDMCEHKEKNFGNARMMVQLVKSIVINHANRIMTTTQVDDFTINKRDVQVTISESKEKAHTQSRIGFV